MNFNYKFIGKCDITNLKNRINKLSEQDWLEHQIRQNVFKAHKHTNTLEVLWDVDNFFSNKVGKVHDNFFKLDIESFLHQIESFYQTFYGNGFFKRVIITRLKSNTIISPHKDRLDSLNDCKRTHIAIQTDPKCIFNIGDEIKHLKEGEIWEINNSQKLHSVENNSNIDRIHIIIDYNIH